MRRCARLPETHAELGIGEGSLTNQGKLIAVLKALRDAGLISADRPDLGEWRCDATFELSPLVGSISRLLKVSIADLSSRVSGESMTVNPFFGLPAPSRDEHADIFVLMPFNRALDPVYSDHIARVAKTLGRTVNRGDDFFTTHDIMGDIWSAICAAKVVVADCTGRNANVFYEIGIAHVVGVPVVLITQDQEDVPFDLRHLRFIEYAFTPRGMTAFEATLSETLHRALAD